MITLKDRYITRNPAYRANIPPKDSRYSVFQERGPLGAVLHSIGTPQPNAEPIAEYFDSPNVQSSVHMILEPSGRCLSLAPKNFRMWHVGGKANDTHLGIEMTEPKEISYDPKRGYAVTVLDREKALSHVKQTYERAVELFAMLCVEYGWDPLADGVILSHDECYRRGWGSNHGDPEKLWKALDTGYTMDGFRADVARYMSRMQNGDEENTEEQKGCEEKRYHTLGDLKQDPNAGHYLPTVEKTIEKGYLRGKGGEGDDLVLDLSEDAVRILVTLDRAGVYG